MAKCDKQQMLFDNVRFMFVLCSFYVLLLSAKYVRVRRCSLQIHSCEVYIFVYGDVSPSIRPSVTGPLTKELQKLDHVHTQYEYCYQIKNP